MDKWLYLLLNFLKFLHILQGLIVEKRNPVVFFFSFFLNIIQTLLWGKLGSGKKKYTLCFQKTLLAHKWSFKHLKSHLNRGHSNVTVTECNFYPYITELGNLFFHEHSAQLSCTFSPLINTLLTPQIPHSVALCRMNLINTRNIFKLNGIVFLIRLGTNPE